MNLLRPRRTFALLLGLASCLPGGRLPTAQAPTRGASPLRPVSSEGAEQGGELRVTFASPAADEVEAPLPTVVFSRPMRRLGEAPELPAVEASIEPRVEGAWHWVGASALQFSPRAGFAPATRYRIEIRPGLRSLDGQVLGAPTLLEFSTPRPRVVGVDEGDIDRADEPLRVSLSQPVDAEALRRALGLRDDRGRPVPFRVGASAHGALEVKPARGRWPAGSALRVTVAASLQGTLGPLPMGKPWEGTVRRREPVVVREIRCSEPRDEGARGVARCERGTDVEIELSATIRAARLRPLVRVEPPVAFELRPAWESDASAETSTFRLRGGFREGVPYRVVVRSSSTRAMGQAGLDVGGELSFRTAPPSPRGALLVQGTYLPPAWTAELQGVVTRARSASFTAAPLDLDAALKAARSGWGEAALPGQRGREVNDPKASADSTFVPLGDLLPSRPGPVLLRASWQGGEDRGETSKVLQRTDLALSSRLSPEGSLVWVTRLSTGEPVGGAEVEVHDLFGRKATAKADAQGVALVDTQPLAVPPPGEREAHGRLRRVLLVARDRDDWLYQEASLPRPARPEAALFSERDLYRPGEPVYLKGVVRLPTSKGMLTPQGREVKLTARLPGGRSWSVLKRLSAWGTLDHEAELPADLPPGRAQFIIEDEHGSMAQRSVLVQHFRSASFEVSASLDRKVYTRGDPFVCQGKASYLYGGSMQGMPYTFSVQREPTSLSMPGLDGFMVGPWRGGGGRSIAAGQGKLGPGGEWAYGAELEPAPSLGPEELTCELTVSEPGEQVRQELARSVVHPGELYAALETQGLRGPLTPGQTVVARVLAVTPSGERRAAPVRVELWPAGERGQAPLASCSVNAGQEPQGCSLRLPEGLGQYYLIEASVSDGKGRRALTSLQLITVDNPTPPRPAPPPPPASPQPPPRPLAPPPPPLLAFDRDDYEAGGTARLRIEPGRAASSGLLTLEREGILEHRVLGASAGGASVDLKLTRAMAPRVRAALTLLRPLASSSPYERPEEPSQRGSTWLRVSASRLLQVKVAPSKAKAAPGEALDVEVSVTDTKGAGAPAEVTLYAVDEGVLSLTGYHAPDLAGQLDPSGELLVEWAETRSQLGWLLRPVRGVLGFGSGRGRAPQVRMGATSVSDRQLLRSDFRPTPLFLPRLLTDGEGRARASFRLPDSLTAYRVMAVAVGQGDLYGQGEATVTASLPAQIRPMVPPVVRAGDRFDVAAVVANNTDEAVDLTAQLEAEGLEAAGAPVRRRLGRGASERVTFPVEARRVGAGKLTFRLVSGDGARDQVALPLSVEAPTAMETAAIYGATAALAEEALADLGSLRPDAGWLEVTASPSPVAGLAPGLEQLIEYPHGCVEQTVSRLVPLLSLRELARALGVALPADADAEGRRAVERLLAARDREGRFGLWPGSRPFDWLTAYGYWGLGEARRRGLPVPDEALERGAALLAQAAGRWPDGKRQAAEACFALDVLADLPQADPALRSHALIVAQQLAAHRGELPPSARALLLHALARLDTAPPAMIDELVAALHIDGPLARAAAVEGYEDLLDSPTRTGALALRALLAASPGHPLIEPLARGLVADRGPGGWRTTQEAAWALLALDDYRRAAGGVGEGLTGRVSLGGRTLLDVSGLREQTARLSMPSLLEGGGAPLRLAAQGGTLHYQARLRYAPAAAPSAPRSAGFEVAKRCAPLPDPPPEGPGGDGALAPAQSFAVGQWVRCQIEVITPTARRFVAIDDPVPGGFEVLDFALRGGPLRLRPFEQGSANRRELRPDRVVYFVDELPAGVHRWSYVARAATAGTFVAPPTRAEEMYTPETFGRTAAASYRISP